MPVPLGLEAAILVVEQDEPAYRHVPWALHDERDGARVPPPRPRQLARRPSTHPVRHEVLGAVDRRGLAEGEHRRQHAEPRPPRADVVLPLDDPDRRGFGLGRQQHAEAVIADLLPVRGAPRPQLPAADDEPFPVGAFVGRECVERLEDAKLCRRDHGWTSIYASPHPTPRSR